jgi:hypothetical protein
MSKKVRGSLYAPVKADEKIRETLAADEGYEALVEEEWPLSNDADVPAPTDLYP